MRRARGSQGLSGGWCLTAVRATRIWVVGFALTATVASIGCIAPPAQRGEIALAAGASERLELAWRFGYVGVEGPEKPATAEVLVGREELPPGVGKNARAGDVLLTSGDVSLIVAAADGTLRAGTLVAAWSTSNPVDELGTMRVFAYDQAVRASSVRPGTDAPTRAAWVDVIGVVDGPGGPIEVTTRYDVAPGVRGVLVHSTLRVPGDMANNQLAIGDVFDAEAGPFREVAASNGAPAALVVSGGAAGYALLAVDAPWAIVDAERGSHGIPALAMPTPVGEVSIFSRFLAVLGRPDALAVAVVQARDVGRGVGEVEIAAVDERGYPAWLAKGTELALERRGGGGGALSFVAPRAFRAGEPILVEVPVGHYTVRRSGITVTDGSGVEVESDRLVRVRVRVAPPSP